MPPSRLRILLRRPARAFPARASAACRGPIRRKLGGIKIRRRANPDGSRILSLELSSPVLLGLVGNQVNADDVARGVVTAGGGAGHTFQGIGTSLALHADVDVDDLACGKR